MRSSLSSIYELFEFVTQMDFYRKRIQFHISTPAIFDNVTELHLMCSFLYCKYEGGSKSRKKASGSGWHSLSSIVSLY